MNVLIASCLRSLAPFLHKLRDFLVGNKEDITGGLTAIYSVDVRMISVPITDNVEGAE